MGSFQIVAVLISLAAIFAYLNHRFLRLHPTVGIMLLALTASGIWLGVEAIWPHAQALALDFRQHLDLNAALFHWILGPLLFAGALGVDLSELKNHRITVGVLAMVGTIVSTFLVAGFCFGFLKLCGMNVPFIACGIFGAVISPTDPVAVLGFLKIVGAPKDIQAIIGGESLFNDGIGVVLFTVLTGASAGHTIGFGLASIAWSFIFQTLGGMAVGLVGGLVIMQMLKRVSNYQVEVLLTLALALSGYTLADALGVSGPIAAVVSGLIIGNHGRSLNASETVRQHLSEFWELVDETLNAILFLLVGLVVLEMHLGASRVLMQLVAIAIVMLARWLSVSCSVLAIELMGTKLRSNTIAVLTWGGLRGALAIAMALSLPPSQTRDLIVSCTYGVVIFSILVQGTTLKQTFRRWVQL